MKWRGQDVFKWLETMEPLMTKQIREVSNGLSREFGNHWERLHKSLIADLRAAVPAEFLECETDTLMTNNMICKLLLQNTKGFGSIGGLVKTLQQASHEIKFIHRDNFGSVVSKAVLDDAREACDDGIKCVVYTFAVHYIRKELPNLQCQTSVDKLIEKVRQVHRASGHAPVDARQDPL